MTFDPKAHLTDLKGKDYLEVKWRILWAREEHPNWRISTELINLDPVIMRASIGDENGAVIATGHGSAKAKQNAVWAGREIEKAETAAIGRALAHAGYGTQFTGEDEDAPADSPVDRRPQQQRPQGNGFKGQPRNDRPQASSYTNPLRPPQGAPEPPPQDVKDLAGAVGGKVINFNDLDSAVSFVATVIETKQHENAKRLYFKGEGKEAVAFSRGKVTGLQDALTPTAYDKLAEVGIHKIPAMRVFVTAHENYDEATGARLEIPA